jgi:GAF domain-containing protein
MAKAARRTDPKRGFSRWLNQQIELKKVDPTVVAARANISAAYVSMIRHGKRRPSYEAVVALTLALDAHSELNSALDAAGYLQGKGSVRSARIARIVQQMREVGVATTAALRERESIAEITLLSPNLTVVEVLCRTLDIVANLIAFDYGIITSVDHDRHEIAVLAHKVGNSPAAFGPSETTRRPWPTTDGVTGWVVRQHKAKRLANVRADPSYLAHWEGTQSELAVPLFHDGNVISVLNLESRTIAQFTDHDERLLETVAENVTAAVVRAREQERLRQIDREWRTRLDNLTDLHRALLAAGDELTLFRTLSAKIVDLCREFEICVVRHNDPEKKALLFMAVATKRGRPVLPLPEIRLTIPADDSISGRAIRDRRPFYIDDVRHDVRFHQKEFAKTLNLGGMVAVPIPSPDLRQPPIGCITAYTTAEQPKLAEDHGRLLEQVADFSAVALSRLAQKQLLTVARWRLANSSKATFDGVASLVCDLTGARAASVFLREQGLLRLRGTTGIRSEQDYAKVIYQMGEGRTGWVALKGKPARMVDRSSREELASFIGMAASFSGMAQENKYEEDIPVSDEPATPTLLAVPIFANVNVVGVIRAVAKAVPFTPLDQHLLELIAAELSGALGLRLNHATDRERLT